MSDEPRTCRCCGTPITIGMLACRNHWFMLPTPLREAILTTYRAHDRASYAANVREADRLWQRAGVWKPR
jgi:hypothetical protein